MNDAYRPNESLRAELESLREDNAKLRAELAEFRAQYLGEAGERIYPHAYSFDKHSKLLRVCVGCGTSDIMKVKAEPPCAAIAPTPEVPPVPRSRWPWPFGHAGKPGVPATPGSPARRARIRLECDCGMVWYEHVATPPPATPDVESA